MSALKTSLVYRVNSRTARATQRNPVSRKEKKKKKKKRRRSKSLSPPLSPLLFNTNKIILFAYLRI
jgi:hypothetical protein